MQQVQFSFKPNSVPGSLQRLSLCATPAEQNCGLMESAPARISQRLCTADFIRRTSPVGHLASQEGQLHVTRHDSMTSCGHHGCCTCCCSAPNLSVPAPLGKTPPAQHSQLQPAALITHAKPHLPLPQRSDISFLNPSNTFSAIHKPS